MRGALRTPKWVTFEAHAVQPPKTKRYRVLTKGSGKEVGGLTLGIVQWWGAWRRYAFFPDGGTLFEPTCLRDIACFCEELTRLHALKVKERRAQAEARP